MTSNCSKIFHPRLGKITLDQFSTLLAQAGKEKLGRDFASRSERYEVMTELSEGLGAIVEGYVMQWPSLVGLAGDPVYNYILRFAEKDVVEKIHTEGESHWPLLDENTQYFYAALVLKKETRLSQTKFPIHSHLKLTCSAVYVIGPSPDTGKYFFSLNCNNYKVIR